MSRKNRLTETPPFAVEQALQRLGSNLRTARLRRNLTIEEVATKIGTGPRAVMDAEKGKPGTSAAAYLSLLWTYDLLDPIAGVADPAKDEEGLSRERARSRARSPLKKGLDNDF